jgi:hypothetical protein
MIWERRRSSSLVFFIFLFYSHVAMVLRRIIASESQHDHLLFTFSCLSVLPAEHCSLENFSGCWHVVIVDF